MGRLILTSAAVTALLAIPAASYAQAQHRRLPSCAPRGAQILLSDPHAQVYWGRKAVFGCTRRSRHHYALSGFNVEVSAIAGTVVAYANGPVVVVRSVRTGQVLHRFFLSVENARQVIGEEARALRILVTSDGAVAWVQEDSFYTHGGNSAPPAAYDIYAVDSGGFRPLGADLPAEPQSMKLVGNTLSWTQGGMHESAVLN